MKYNTPLCMLVAKLAKFGKSLLNRTENSWFIVSVCSVYQSAPFLFNMQVVCWI